MMSMRIVSAVSYFFDVDCGWFRAMRHVKTNISKRGYPGGPQVSIRPKILRTKSIWGCRMVKISNFPKLKPDC